MLGEKLLEYPGTSTYDNITVWCSKNATTGDIWHRYCINANGTDLCEGHFIKDDISIIPGIPGLASGVVYGTTMPLLIYFIIIYYCYILI